MKQEIKDKLIAAGRQDLIDAYEVKRAGYAGVLSNGNIVDRRKHPEAIAMQKNSLLDIPEPKDL